MELQACQPRSKNVFHPEWCISLPERCSSPVEQRQDLSWRMCVAGAPLTEAELLQHQKNVSAILRCFSLLSEHSSSIQAQHRTCCQICSCTTAHELDDAGAVQVLQSQRQPLDVNEHMIGSLRIQMCFFFSNNTSSRRR